MKKRIVKTFIVSIASSFCLATPICAAESDNAAAFEEEQYTLWLENYEDELEIGEISYNPETDWDWSYYSSGYVSKIAKGEKGYYVRLGEFIYFCSFEHEKLIPLCVRPDCLHNKEEDEEKKQLCMAYVTNRGILGGVQYYKEKLYANYQSFFSGTQNGESSFWGDSFYVLEPDGSSRETLDLKLEQAIGFIIHRGNIYYTLQTESQSSLERMQTIYQVPMDGGDAIKVAQLNGNAVFSVYPYGDYLYGRCGLEGASYFFLYDTKTNKTTAAHRFESEEVFFLHPWEDGFIGNDNDKLFQISSDLKQMEQIGTLTSDNKNEFGISDNEEIWLYSLPAVDEEYLYFQGSVTTQEEIKEFVAIYEKENLELQQIIFVDGMPDSQCIGVDENQIFFTGRTEDGDAVFWLEKETMLEKDAQFHVLQP